MSGHGVHYKGFLVWLFVVSFLIRAAVFYSYLSVDNNYWQVDSKTYDTVACRIAHGNGISHSDGTPHFYRVPGYPLFLAAYYRLFGHDHTGALWIQVLIASLIPCVIFLLALTLFPAKIMVAIGAGFYSCIHLGLVLYSGFFMTESLFLFFFLLFLLLFLPSFELFFEKRKKATPVSLSLIGAGFFLGIASLIRPVGHYVVVVGSLLLLLSNDKWSKKISKGFTFVVGWLIPVSWWLIRNLVLTGHLFFHTLPGGHFLYLSAARVAMHVHDTSYQGAREILHDQVERDIKQEAMNRGRPLQEIERCLMHERLAMHYFKMRPLITLKNWMTDIFRATFSLYSAELLYLDTGRQDVDYFARGRGFSAMVQRYLFPQTSHMLLRMIVYLEILFYFLMLFGCALFFGQSFVDYGRYRKTLKLSVLIKTVPFIGLFLVIALSGGYARMRLPIEPFLIILSCAGYWVYVRIGKSKTSS